MIHVALTLLIESVPGICSCEMRQCFIVYDFELVLLCPVSNNLIEKTQSKG